MGSCISHDLQYIKHIVPINFLAQKYTSPFSCVAKDEKKQRQSQSQSLIQVFKTVPIQALLHNIPLGHSVSAYIWEQGFVFFYICSSNLTISLKPRPCLSFQEQKHLDHPQRTRRAAFLLPHLPVLRSNTVFIRLCAYSVSCVSVLH